MALELKIYSPKDPGGYLKEIEWNYEELRDMISEKMEDYKGLTYTESQINEAKEDRAQLNKFEDALEAKRKEVKAAVNAPYDKFEKEVKELIGIIDEAKDGIDRQIKEHEKAEKDEKKREIESIFLTIGFPEYVTLDKIWNPKWLNKSYKMTAIRKDLTEKENQIGLAVATLRSLPAYGEEAMILYEKSLSLPDAINEAKWLTDIHNRAEEQRKAAETAKNAAQEAPVKEPEDKPSEAVKADTGERSATQAATEESKRFTVLITAKKSQFKILNELFGNVKKQGIDIQVIKKEVI